MRGVVFTEFLDMVERRFSLRLADAMLLQSRVRSGGAYTVVGTYDACELTALATQLSLLTAQPVDQLLYDFGRHLFAQLATRYQALLRPHSGTFALLANLNSLLNTPPFRQHGEPQVQIVHDYLTPASLRIGCRFGGTLRSFAHGLLQGCADHFADPIRIDPDSTDATSLCFLLTKQSAI